METNVEDKDLLKARRPNDKEMDNFQYCYVEVMTVKKKWNLGSGKFGSTEG